MDCKIRLTRKDYIIEVESNTIKEINQPEGDLTQFFDICGTGWMRCPNCKNKKQGCGKRFHSATIKSESEPIEVIFIDGRIELFDTWERIKRDDTRAIIGL